MVIFFLQHGETALHLVAKYNHPGVISAFGTFKVPMDIRGKVCSSNNDYSRLIMQKKQTECVCMLCNKPQTANFTACTVILGRT